MASSNASATATASGGGIGLIGAVFLVFLVFKLAGVIAWSWWWVTAPIWGPFALVFGVLLIALFLWVLVVLGSRAHDMFVSWRRKLAKKKASKGGE